jgi:UDP-N-acetylmuramoyl-tripeptide--D-alanyl-D-alanine ligase
MTSLQELYNRFMECQGVSTDSRTVKEGDIFFALNGENFNGNSFAVAALNNGARYAVIDDISFQLDKRFLLVDNSLDALQQIAAHHRMQFRGPLIALTGSNGKTTTKELINRVLSAKYTVHATRGNLNNHIGVPLSLLGLKNDTEIAVIEMGANHSGEIAALCKIARPSHGLITNIGKAHLEGFGSYEGVIKAKTELYEYLKISDGLAFVNADDKLLMNKSAELRRITYGSDADVIARITRKKPMLAIEWSRHQIQSQLYGSYNFQNLSTAICVGKTFEVADEDIIKAIESYIPDNSRSQLIIKGSNTIYLDAYNANPTSMLLAIEDFATQEAGNKVLILGDMLELGNEAEEEHTKLLSYVKNHFDHLFLVGPEMMKAAKEHGMSAFTNTDAAADHLRDHPISNAHILIKGSRGIALERLLKYL